MEARPHRKGEFTREFMREIAEMTRHMVERAKQYEADTIPGDFGVLSAPCPKCGGRSRDLQRNSSAAGLRLRAVEDRRLAASTNRLKIDPADRTPGRPADRLPQQDGRSFAAAISSMTTCSRNSISARTKPAEDGQRRRSISPAEALGKCPKCAAGGSMTRQATTSVKRPSAPARLRLPFRQDHPAAAHRRRPDEEAAGRRQRPTCSRIRFQPYPPQVLGLSGQSERQGWVRIRKGARCEKPAAKKKAEAASKAGSSVRHQLPRRRTGAFHSGAGQEAQRVPA